MAKEVELTKLTSDLILEIERLKKSVKEDMMVGEKEILKGIVFVEEVVKELNPVSLNDEIVCKIKYHTCSVLSIKEEQMQRVSNHIHYGIFKCFLMLEGYNRKINKHILDKNGLHL